MGKEAMALTVLSVCQDTRIASELSDEKQAINRLLFVWKKGQGTYFPIRFRTIPAIASNPMPVKIRVLGSGTGLSGILVAARMLMYQGVASEAGQLLYPPQEPFAS